MKMKTLSLLSLTILLFASCTKQVEHAELYNKFKSKVKEKNHIIIKMNMVRTDFWYEFTNDKFYTYGNWWQTDVPIDVESTAPDSGTYTLVDGFTDYLDEYPAEGKGKLVLFIKRNEAVVVDSVAGNYTRTGTWQLVSATGEYAYLKRGGGILTNTIHFPRYTEANDMVDFESMEFDLEGLGQ